MNAVGYPFPVKTCPNAQWHPAVKRRCPMCGLYGSAFRFGQRLAAVTVGTVLAIVIIGGGALLWRVFS